MTSGIAKINVGVVGVITRDCCIGTTLLIECSLMRTNPYPAKFYNKFLLRSLKLISTIEIELCFGERESLVHGGRAALDKAWCVLSNWMNLRRMR